MSISFRTGWTCFSIVPMTVYLKELVLLCMKSEINKLLISQHHKPLWFKEVICNVSADKPQNLHDCNFKLKILPMHQSRFNNSLCSFRRCYQNKSLMQVSHKLQTSVSSCVYKASPSHLHPQLSPHTTHKKGPYKSPFPIK